jgi:hypothetical protein
VFPSHHARNGPRGFGLLSVHQLEHNISKEILLNLGVLGLVELNKLVHMGVLFRQNLGRGLHKLVHVSFDFCDRFRVSAHLVLVSNFDFQLVLVLFDFCDFLLGR